MDEELHPELLRRAERDQQARHIAYLTDRILLGEGSPQGYGTQVTSRADRWMPRPGCRFPCQHCSATVEAWLPEPGEETEATCPSCGWTTTVRIG